MTERIPWLKKSPWKNLFVTPPLVVGKGPGCGWFCEGLHNRFTVITLNHACILTTEGFAHFVDLDALLDCEDHLRGSRQVILLPVHPHIDNRPSKQSVNQLAERIPFLKDLQRAGRIEQYFASNHPGLPRRHTATLRRFSAEAVFSLLIQDGATAISSLGIAGGDLYDVKLAEFTHRQFTNGAHTYEASNQILETMCKVARVKWLRLGPELSIFIGGTKHEQLQASVLEHSIRRYSKLVTEIRFLSEENSLDEAQISHAGTKFSFQRFAVPILHVRECPAIYMDSDMLVVGDFCANLDLSPNQPGVYLVDTNRVPRRALGPKFHKGWQLSFMVFHLNEDIKRTWSYDSLLASVTSVRDYEDLMFGKALSRWIEVHPTLPNCLNEMVSFEDSTVVRHYTVVPEQPWRRSSAYADVRWLEEARQWVKNPGGREVLDAALLFGEVSRSVYGVLYRCMAGEVGAPKPMQPNLRGITSVSFLRGAGTNFINRHLSRVLKRKQSSGRTWDKSR